MTSSDRPGQGGRRQATHRAPGPSRRRRPSLAAVTSGRRWWSAALAVVGRRWRWLAPAAAIGLAALVVLVYAVGWRTGPAAGSSRGAAPAGGAAVSGRASPGGATVHRASRETPEQVVASVHLPSGLTAALRKWESGSGGKDLANVSSQLGAATQASGIRLFGPMRQDCSDLASAVTAATSGPPIPDSVMQGTYRRALAKLAAAAATCQAGISLYPTEDQGLQAREDPATIGQADAEFATGARELYQATVDIHALHRR